MQKQFIQALERLLKGAHERPAPPDRKAPPTQSNTIADRHRKWFVQYAEEHVAPMLTQTVEALKHRGFAAESRLVKREDDDVTAEFIVTPPHLPHGARPPRLTISAAEARSGLAIDYTGTFPHSGAGGGFGAEIVYDTIHTEDLEAQIFEFVRKAVGA